MAAAMARILSSGLMFDTTTGLAAGRWVAGAAEGAAAGVRVWATGAAEDLNAGAPAGGGCMGAPLDAPVGPPGGSVGNLMVGAAVGLGGKLMRTVSFLG